MNTSDCQRLCDELMRADNEDDVVKILQEAGLWENENYWRYYGDDELNWNRAGNQQSRADFALNEKLVNMIDSRLMLECMLRGISPEGPEAPQSIREGVNRFIENSSSDSLKVTGGRVEDWPPAYRTKIASDMAVFVTGDSKTSFCVNIVDLGEGQTPAAFPETLLSLGKHNKIRINFVQGKFGQGSTGALRFCGDLRLQLIISKRHPKLLQTPPIRSDYPIRETDDHWGFTVIRREGQGLKVRSPFYSYLAPINSDNRPRRGEVLCFRRTAIPLFPDGDMPYSRNVEHGTLIKLYSYRLKGKSNILRRDGLRAKMDLLLPEPALPLRFHECRRSFRSSRGQGTRQQVETMSGLVARLRDNPNLEDVKPDTFTINIGQHDLTGRIFAFKPGVSKTYRKQEGIIFSINGQTQGYIKASFFARKAVDLQRIATDLLVVLDCSAFSAVEQDDIFMPSRDRLVEDNAIANEIESKLESALRNHRGLRELKHRRAAIDAEQKVANDEILSEKINQIAKNFPTIAQFFGRAKALRHMPKVKLGMTKRSDKEFIGKKHPSYFRFAQKDQGVMLERNVHLGQQARIEFVTDAVNDYFSRKIDAGRLSVKRVLQGEDCVMTSYMHTLVDGKCNVYLDLPPEVSAGDVMDITFIVDDPTTYKMFKNPCRLYVKRKVEARPHRGKKRSKQGDHPGQDMRGSIGLRMPEVRWLRKEQPSWGTHFSTEDDCLRIVEEQEQGVGGKETRYEFFLSEENKILRLERRNAKVPEVVVRKQFEIGMVLVGLSLLHYINQANNSNLMVDGENENWDFDDLVKMVSSAMAPVIVPLIQGFGDWDGVESEGDDLVGQAG